MQKKITFQGSQGLSLVKYTKGTVPFVYKAGQLKIDKVGFDPEIRKHINDVFITIAKEHDAD